jgi:hypothetical protein
MTVSYVERTQANAETRAFYDKAEARFEMLLNIFKVFGHTPELGLATHQNWVPSLPIWLWPS